MLCKQMNNLYTPVKYSLFCLFGLALLLHSCAEAPTQPEGPVETTPAKISFTPIPSTTSGVDFNNQLEIRSLKSYFDYINIFTGGGVALGDINNDGLVDAYFTGNQADNKLYLNQGDFKFTDITAKAGVAAADSWSTGTTMADVNQDGFLDIYVCRSYHDSPEEKRANLLFINNGDGTFSEKGKEYGVADTNYSIQAAFLDYDKDGWIDLYVGNHPRELRKSVEEHLALFNNPVMESSDHLYRNNGDGTFTDVTEQAGILNYGWTLGLSIADLDKDGWQDIYVTVDHDQPDRMYHNNGDGTFSEIVKETMRHISLSSMGVDAADYNNDGLPDLYAVDMLAQDNYRQKTQMASMAPEKFEYYKGVGYHAQFMRNMLQLNTGKNRFSEIGQMAKLHETDWSWAVLFADLDNDGWKDLYVSNGYYRNTLDKDKRYELIKKSKIAVQQGKDPEDIYQDYIENLSSAKLKNLCFQNQQDLTFENVSASSGLDYLGLTNGAAYADLDNDGDLDIVTNNIDAPAGIFRNQAQEQGQYHYLRIALEAPQPIGTKVTLYTAQGEQYQELLPTRGFESSVEYRLHFGLGNQTEIDRLLVEWPDGRSQELNQVKADQQLVININDATGKTIAKQETGKTYFEELANPLGLEFTHQENDFNDYDRQILLPHKMSQFGPFISTGDINGDQRSDCFVGGAAGQAGQFFVQQADGTFKAQSSSALQADKAMEDMGSAFFDVDGDGDLDLYVVSGGNAFIVNAPQYQDRLYLNDGQGNFAINKGLLPKIRTSGSCVKPADFDQDGDVDLFVGGRQTPWSYPMPTNSYLLENEGGKLMNVGHKKASMLNQIGMVTDAHWGDLNGDGTTDLMVVGEWMQPRLLIQQEGKFVDDTDNLLPDNYVGWWNRIAAADIDGDGDMDFVLGNLGKNYKYRATPLEPFHIYGSDFDGNGSSDIVLGYFNSNTLFPVRGRQCSSQQIPDIAQKFPSYDAFAKASIEEVYGDQLESAVHYEATNFASSLLILDDNGKYRLQDLPNEAQIAPINGITCLDFDADGHLDILAAGNLYVSEVETGRADAGQGILLKGDGQGNFDPLPFHQTGVFLPGDVKDLGTIEVGGKTLVLVTNNNGPLQVLEKL